MCYCRSASVYFGFISSKFVMSFIPIPILAQQGPSCPRIPSRALSVASPSIPS